MQFNVPKRGFAIFSVLVLLGIGAITVWQIGYQQIFRSKADTVSADWDTTQSAATACASNGDAIINVSFTNTETAAGQDMIVTATDQQTNVSINLGTIDDGQTKTGTINTGKTSLAAGTVLFTMVWSYDTSESDTRTANYEGISYCPPPSPTITPSPSPTMAPGITPSITPSPTVCPTPGSVTNVQIQCPYCTPSPTASP